jgi:PucR C-terminal helix-turn-helix domain/GGDEF-like domain
LTKTSSSPSGHESSGDFRRALADRLRENSAELEQLVSDRLCALEGASTFDEQMRERGLQGVIRPVLEYGFVAVELGERCAPSPPPAVIAHAREAAWRSTPLQTLFERYFAGYAVFKHFLLREKESLGSASEATWEIQGSTDVVFERLFRAVGEEHERERQRRSRSTETLRLERVEGLLSGELLEAPELQYPLEANHLGLVGSGPDAAATIQRVARSVGARLLLVRPSASRVWAWIGTLEELSESKLDEALRAKGVSSARISLGEPSSGLPGWRRTHQQAEAAFTVVARDGSPARYAEVAVLASMARDHLLRASLREIYLAPLAEERDGGRALRGTLRAYFAADRNGASAAAALKVTRQTIGNRLQKVEDRLGRPLHACTSELEAALKLMELDPSPES